MKSKNKIIDIYGVSVVESHLIEINNGVPTTGEEKQKELLRLERYRK